jgi:hypothetical protein
LTNKIYPRGFSLPELFEDSFLEIKILYCLGFSYVIFVFYGDGVLGFGEKKLSNKIYPRDFSFLLLLDFR